MLRIETAGTTSKKTGTKFAVIVKLDDTSEQFSYLLGGQHTLNQIELIAIKFAVMGAEATSDVVITTPNRYVHGMFACEGEGDQLKWTKIPKSNVELITEIREYILARQSTGVNIEVVCEKSEEAKSLCRAK